ncbi:MAG: hypothetical protein RLZ97_2392 [Verrucomicrobiota bacterium]
MVELAEGFEPEVGSGLDAWGIAAADHGLEVFPQIEAVQPAIDPMVGGARNDGAWDACGGEQIEGGKDPGHGAGEFEVAMDFDLAGSVELMPIETASGEFLEVELGRPGIEVRADAAHVGGQREVVTVGGEGALPGLVDGPLGIDQNAIEVEEDGLKTHEVRMAWARADVERGRG